MTGGKLQFQVRLRLDGEDAQSSIAMRFELLDPGKDSIVQSLETIQIDPDEFDGIGYGTILVNIPDGVIMERGPHFAKIYLNDQLIHENVVYVS